MKDWFARPKGWVMSGMLLILAGAAGCSSSTAICHCPGDGCDFSCSRGTAVIAVGPDLAPLVSSVTATSTCSVELQPGITEIVVSRTNGAGDCDVVAHLTDGTTATAHLHFTTDHAACGCYVGAAGTTLQIPGPASM